MLVPLRTYGCQPFCRRQLGIESKYRPGIDGNQADNSASGAGAVYVFTRSGTIWSQQAYLKASNTNVGDLFGDNATFSTGRSERRKRNITQDATTLRPEGSTPRSGLEYLPQSNGHFRSLRGGPVSGVVEFFVCRPSCLGTIMKDARRRSGRPRGSFAIGDSLLGRHQFAATRKMPVPKFAPPPDK